MVDKLRFCVYNMFILIEESDMNIIRPAIYNGQKLTHYGVDSKTGDIYSFFTKEPRKLKWAHRNPRDLKNSYPCVRLVDKKVFKDYSKHGLTINIHILVHETLCSTPRPRGVTKKEWSTTANSIKRACRALWQVNHKDHNRINYNPKNLEWVTAKENAQAAQKHYNS